MVAGVNREPIETIVARLTSAGRSAVAVIGLRGDQATAVIDACFDAANPGPYQPGQVRYGVWTASGETASGESIVLTPIAENHYELHVHGGSAATRRIIASMSAWAVTEVEADAFATIDPLRSEIESVLTRCTTVRNAAIALGQCRSGLRSWVDQWRTILSASSPAEFVDLDALKASAAVILRYEHVGLRLCVPYRVVLAGPPNVGKSSLINRIVGYGRSITHDAPGTTRDVIDCETVIDGIPIRLSDTAGIRAGGDTIEREGIRRGAIAIADADLIVLVVSPFCMDELESLRVNAARLAPTAALIEVLNQADRLDQIPHAAPDSLHRTIALPYQEDGSTVDGIDVLMDKIVRAVRPHDPPVGQPIPVTHRHIDCLRRLVEEAGDVGSAKKVLLELSDFESRPACQPGLSRDL